MAGGIGHLEHPLREQILLASAWPWSPSCGASTDAPATRPCNGRAIDKVRFWRAPGSLPAAFRRRREPMSDSEPAKQFRLERRSAAYWRVTFDNPPLNIFGPEHMPALNAVVAALETDREVKVVVFDSAVEGFFATHYNFLAKPEDTLDQPPGRTGLQQLPDALVRISRAPAVSIAKIRGRATGVGSELALACDMRFASRDNAILSQWEG